MLEKARNFDFYINRNSKEKRRHLRIFGIYINSKIIKNNKNIPKTIDIFSGLHVLQPQARR